MTLDWDAGAHLHHNKGQGWMLRPVIVVERVETARCPSVIQASTTGSQMYARPVLTSSGSMLLAGLFRGDATFGHGEPNQTTLKNTGDRDIFVAAYRPEGTLRWVQGVFGPGRQELFDAVVLPDESIIIVGGLESSSATVGSGPSAIQLSGMGGLVARLDRDGTPLWARNLRCGWWPTVTEVELAKDGNGVVISGNFGGTITFAPGVQYTAKDVDAYVARFDLAGNFEWAVVMKMKGHQKASASWVEVLPDGGFYVGGKFWDGGSAVFEHAGGATTTLTATGIGPDGFIARYDANRNCVWAKQIEATSAAVPAAQLREATVLSDGSLVVVGAMTGKLTFAPGEPEETSIVASGSQDGIMARYNKDGALQWVRRMGGSGSDYWTSVVALDDSIVVNGLFSGTAALENKTLSSAGGADVVTAVYTANGALSWFTTHGGPNADSSNYLQAGPGNSIIMTSSFAGQTTALANTADPISLTGRGNLDLYALSFTLP